MANRIGMNVKMQFNGVTVIAKPGADLENMIKLWRDTLHSKSQYKIVVGHPVEREIAREEV